MSLFGRTQFSGNRFTFWALAPFLIMFAVAMPLSITQWSVARVILIISLDLCAVLLTIGLYDTTRFWWALRGVTAIVFLAYLAYLIDALVHWKTSISLKSILAGDAPWGAIRGFMGIGIPCLLFSVLGRFSRHESSENTADAPAEPGDGH
jgi:L-asparagine transporter-like permease